MIAMWMQAEIWISAFRPRTLILAFSSISMGALLSLSAGAFRWEVYALSISTAIFLQILSNLANDYGDYIHGADHAERTGPTRAVQSGAITKKSMQAALIILLCLCLISGICLLGVALRNTGEMLFFFGLGVLSILAAVAYTMGKNPYGYQGLGDLFVFIFFGPVGVMGSLYLSAQQLSWSHLLPAISCGAFSVAVLNINNIRDMQSDRKARKKSIPVRIGRKKAILYHWTLLFVAILSTSVYTAMDYRSSAQLLFLVSAPLLVLHAIRVSQKPLRELDTMLRHMVLIMLIFVLFFGTGILLAKK